MSEQVQSGELPEGIYDGTCTGEVTYGVSSTGGEQVALELLLPNEMTVWTILAFAGKARAISINKLKACGWPQSGDIGTAIRGQVIKIRIAYRDWTNPDGDVEKRINVEILDGSPRFKFSQEMTESQRENFLHAITANAPAAANDNNRGYPANWDQAPNFSLRKPKVA